MRADTVYLKTLAGLRRVHAILRRLDDDYCDPLELRADSALGVPGLLGAVRAGRVMLANALGSGVLESAAWLGFLPGASQSLLGEPLRLPSVATWWCGERPALDYVITHLDQLVIKPTFPNQQFEPCFGRDLGREERAALIVRLRARPYAYVAQERVSLSQAPSWRAGATRAARAAHADHARVCGRDPRRLPGHAGRTGAYCRRGRGRHRLQPAWRRQQGRLGARRHDAAEPASRTDSAGEAQALPRRTRHDELPSQLVENLYWLGRYSERCEDKARLLRATLAMRTNAAGLARARASSASATVCCPRRAIPRQTVFDDAHEFGLAADLGRLGWCATQSRSRLSAEHWRSISVMQRAVPRGRAHPARSAGGARPAAGVADRAQRLRAR